MTNPAPDTHAEGRLLPPDPVLPSAAPSRSVFAQWSQIPDWSVDSTAWNAPSSFVLYDDGSWTLAISRLYNGYNSYGPFERKFSVRWHWTVKYLDAQGGVRGQIAIVAGDEGYLGVAHNVLKTGVDPALPGLVPEIASLTAQRRQERYY